MKKIVILIAYLKIRIKIKRIKLSILYYNKLINSANRERIILDHLLESVTVLLNDFHFFTEIASEVNFSNYQFALLDYFDYPVTFYYLELDKQQVSSPTEAFVVLYLKTLYMNNGWEDEEADIGFLNYLENIWIPEDFSRFRDRNTFLISISEWHDDKFSKEALQWMNYFNLNASEMNNFRLKHIDSNVIRIGKEHTRRFCFGETDTTYFLTEFGA